MIVLVMRMVMAVIVVMMVVLMTFVIRMGMSGREGICVSGLRLGAMFVAFLPGSGLRRIGAGVLDNLALDPFATAAAARVAVAGTAAVGAILALLFGLAMGAFVRLDQGLTVGYRNLVVIGVDFAEGQKAVAVAAIFDEGRLQRRLHAGDLGEVDVAAQLLALGGLEIKLFDAIAADHDDPGFFRVGGIDQHFVGHFETLDGGGRVSR